MLLDAVVSKNEIQALLEALTPLRISIDERRGRSVILGRPELVLVPGRGLRLRGDARITWDVAGVSIPVTIDAWQVLLVPRVITRGDARVLAFDPIVEDLDLKHVPSFLSGKILAAIREGIAQNQGRLAWSFGRALSRQLTLPNKLGAGSLALTATDAAVTISADTLSLAVTLEAALLAKAPASGRRVAA